MKKILLWLIIIIIFAIPVLSDYWVRGDLNVTGNASVGGNVTANAYCDSSGCGNISEFLASGSGGGTDDQTLSIDSTNTNDIISIESGNSVTIQDDTNSSQDMINAVNQTGFEYVFSVFWSNILNVPNYVLASTIQSWISSNNTQANNRIDGVNSSLQNEETFRINNDTDIRNEVDNVRTSVETNYTELDNKKVNREGDTMTGDLNMSGNSLTDVNYTDYILGSNIPYKEGRVYYDNEQKTLVYYNDKEDVKVNIGEKLLLRAKNVEGSTIYNGDVVYVVGSSGDNPQVKLAQADNLNTSRMIGMVTETSISNNGVGYITTFGRVRKLDTSMYSTGDTIYLSSTEAGNYTNIKPNSPDKAFRVGTIVRSHSTEGSVFIDTDREIDTFNTGDVIFANGDGELIEDDNFTYNSTTNTLEVINIIGNGSQITDVDADKLDGQDGSYYLDNTDSQDITTSRSGDTVTIDISGGTGDSFTDNYEANTDVLGDLSCSDTEIVKYNATSGVWECESDETGSGTSLYSGTGIEINSTDNITMEVPYRLPQTCTDDQVAKWNNTLSKWECAGDEVGSEGSGEANDGANIGTDGYGVYDGKSSTTLQFRNIASISKYITITFDATDNDIDIELNETELNATSDARDDFEANTDNQALSWDSGTNEISIEDGNAVDIGSVDTKRTDQEILDITDPEYINYTEEPDLNVNDSDYLDGQHGSYYLDNTDNQDITTSRSGDTVTIDISGGTGDTFTDNYEPDTTIGNCSGDGSCDNILYDSEHTLTLHEGLGLLSTNNNSYVRGLFSSNNGNLTYNSATGVFDLSMTGIRDWIYSFIDTEAEFETEFFPVVTPSEDKDTNASTACSGTNTYLSGDGTCETDDNTNTQLDDEVPTSNVNMDGYNITTVDCVKFSNGAEWCGT